MKLTANDIRFLICSSVVFAFTGKPVAVDTVEIVAVVAPAPFVAPVTFVVPEPFDAPLTFDAPVTFDAPTLFVAIDGEAFLVR
jgi:hypothetical protein